MNIEISIENEAWNELDVDSIADECVEETFAKLDLHGDGVEICMLFTDDNEIRALNRTFRGIDSATNVLSFPATPIEDCECGDDCHCHDDCDCGCEEHDCILGSIAIAYETMQRESEEQGKTLENHLRHLIVHSTLHLLGYDHIEAAEAKEMENLEVKILKRLGVEDPYQ